MDRPRTSDIPIGWRPEGGTFSPHQYTRINRTLDQTPLGRRALVETSLRGFYEASDKTVLYVKDAIGDTLFQAVSYTQALALFYQQQPSLKKPLEIVTTHGTLLEGLSEQFDFVSVRQLQIGSGFANSVQKNTAYLHAIHEDAQSQRNAFFIATDQQTVPIIAAISPMFVDGSMERLRNGLPEHPFPYRHPHARILSYPSRIGRFMEMVLGERFIDDPTTLQVNYSFPATGKIEQTRVSIRQRLRDYFQMEEDPTIHTLFLANRSISAKQFSPEQIYRFLYGMVEACKQDPTGKSRVVLVSDPTGSLLDSMPIMQLYTNLPEDMRRYIRHFQPRNEVVAAALVTESASVIGPDSGFVYFAAASGVNVVDFYTAADYTLWTTNTQFEHSYVSHEATRARATHQMIYGPSWDNQPVIGMKQFSVTQDLPRILASWRSFAFPNR